MNYTLHQLEIFLEVVKWKSITEAARQMNMSQPALSIQLKNFQQQFNIPLSEVIGRKLHITEFGYTVAEMAERILLEADELRQRTKAFSGLVTGELKFTCPHAGKYVLPYLLTNFLKARPGVKFTFKEMSNEDIGRAIQKNKLDFALVSQDCHDWNVNEEWIMDNKWVVVGDSKVIHKKKPLLTHNLLNTQEDNFKKILGKHTISENMASSSLESIKHMVMAGFGYAVLPLVAIKNELESHQLHVLPAKGMPVLEHWRFAWHKDKKMSPVAQAFLSYFKKHREELLETKFYWHQNFTL